MIAEVMRAQADSADEWADRWAQIAPQTSGAGEVSFQLRRTAKLMRQIAAGVPDVEAVAEPVAPDPTEISTELRAG
jgi:hypothetical protein